MTSTDNKSEQDAFLASKRATWNSFMWLSAAGLGVIVLILVLMAAFLL